MKGGYSDEDAHTCVLRPASSPPLSSPAQALACLGGVAEGGGIWLRQNRWANRSPVFFVALDHEEFVIFTGALPLVYKACTQQRVVSRIEEGRQ